MAGPVLNKNAEVVKQPKPTRRYVVRQRTVRADSCSALHLQEGCQLLRDNVLRSSRTNCRAWLPPHKHTHLPTKKPAAPQILLQPPQALSFSFSFNPLQFFLYKADNTFRPLLRALRGFLSR